MGRFPGLGSTRTNNGSGVYFQEGNHVVQVVGVKYNQDRNRVNQFIVVGKILASDNPKQVVGSEPSMVLKLRQDDNLATKWGDVKAFAAAVAGIETPDAYIPEDAEGLVGDKQAEAVDNFWNELLDAIIEGGAADGQILGLVGVNIKVGRDLPEEKKRNFTKLRWAHLTDEEISELGLAA